MPILTHADLAACIGRLPAVTLAALTLFGGDPSAQAGWFPTSLPQDAVVQATLELIAYGTRCATAAHRLSGLRPVPLPVPIMEYAL